LKGKNRTFKEGDPPFLLRVELLRDRIEDSKVYPFNLPALHQFERLELHPKVTYLIGENGTGKSTLLEAIAVASGFNPEGGTTNFNFATRHSESSLHRTLRLVRSVRRPRTGYFLRAESFFNVASNIEELDREPAMAPPIINSYGKRSLHEQSHGESFMALLKHRFGSEGLYILDEPEAALSPARQLAFLTKVHELVRQGSQLLIATHAPIVLAYPDASIYELSGTTIALKPYDETHVVETTKQFLLHRERYLASLLESC
jgi:predicted ATPase